MKSFFYKCNFVVAFFLVLSAIFPHHSLANQYGVMCDSPFIWASTDQLNYCNTNTAYSDLGGIADPDTVTAIQTLSRMNIFFGYGASECAAAGVGYPCFQPNNHITRWEVAAAITRYHIYIKRDWYAWDPAFAPTAELLSELPTKNADGTYLADVFVGDPGYLETHNALLHRWFYGGDCSTYYPYDSGTGKYYDAAHDNYVDGDARCFGRQGDWIFGFHGVERASAAYLYYTDFPVNTPPDNHKFYYCNYYSPVQSGPGSCEEAWQGDWYKFATGGDTTPGRNPNYMTRAEFAKAMYDYYVDVDNNNYCGSSQTATFTGTALLDDPDAPSQKVCPIHAGETQCSTPITWSTTHMMNNVCNKPRVYNYVNYTQTFIPGAEGLSGSFTSDASTGEYDIKTYYLNYYFQMNQDYHIAGQFNTPLGTVSFYGKPTSASITFPSGVCTIPSNSNTCNQTISWSSKLTDGSTVELRDVTWGGSTVIGTGLTGTVNNYSIQGFRQFQVFENGLPLSSIFTIIPNKLHNITGTIYEDYNNNAAVDVSQGDKAYTGGALVTLLSSSNAVVATTTTDASGNYNFADVDNITYKILLPSTIGSFRPTSVKLNPHDVTVNFSDTQDDLYITPNYSITGGVFIDTDKNGSKDGGESFYTGGAITITNSSGGTITYPASGTFAINDLAYGTYTVTYTSSIPSGYQVTIPKGGAGSPAYTVNIGTPCSSPAVSPTGGDGTCDASGNITNLNFGITTSIPWIQGFGMDMRFDGGFTNAIPSLNNACGGIYTMMPTTASDSTSQGLVAIGNSSATSSFGVRQTPSSSGWIMDTLYPETYQPVVAGTVRTSYGYVLGAINRAGLTQTEISTNNGCTDPTISCSLANLTNGVYTHTGDVVLSALTIPANRNIFLLIKGNLSITGAITVPTTSTLTVAVGDNDAGTAGNITVASGLGSVPACVPPTGQLQGFFTADKTMTIDGINDCAVSADQMLTVEGAIVVNASLTSGSLTVNRDLCAGDTSYPALMIKERPDFILHAPDVLKQQNYLFQELAP